MTKPDREELEALARQLDHLTMDTMKQSGDDLREERDRLRGEVAALTQALAESREALREVEKAADREGCSRSGCNAYFENPRPTHTPLCPIFYRNIASAVLTPPQQEKKPCLDPELHEIRPCDCHDQEKI